MTPDEIVCRFPRLYHVTEPGAHESVRRHGLLSTVALLDLFETPESERRQLLHARRPDPVSLSHPVHGQAILNDQRPLSMKALETCLDDGLAPADWLGILNGKVFFWPDEKQLQRLTQARANRKRQREVLVFDTARLLEDNFDRLSLSPINTGNTMRRPARRGLATFALAKDHGWEAWRTLRGRRDSVVEIAINHRVASAGDALAEVRRVGEA